MQTLTASRPNSLAFTSVFPGLTLVAILAAAAFGLRQIPGLGIFSPIILGILVGMVFSNAFSVPASAAEGVQFAAKRLLRIGVALLGFQVTLSQVGALGIAGFGTAALALFSTYFFTIWMGRRLGVNPELTGLIAAGSSICGASAIAAADLSIQGKDEDVAYAISCVTVFGTICMFAFPAFMSLLHMSPEQYGVWSGASIHEVAQVAGAGFQGGDDAGTTAIVVKLSRVLMLAPLLIVMGLIAARTKPAPAAGAKRPPLVPFFLIGFVAIMLLNSTGMVPQELRDGIVGATPILLTLSLTALGLGTDFRKLKTLGLKPLLLGALATIWIATVSLIAALTFF